MVITRFPGKDNVKIYILLVEAYVILQLLQLYDPGRKNTFLTTKKS